MKGTNLPLYDKTQDRYAEMTEEAVQKLWNDGHYSIEGLRNIALRLLQTIEEGN